MIIMRRIEPKLNLIQIQDRYVARVNAAYGRWSHRIRTHVWGVSGGHYSRARGAAHREAAQDLRKWGFTDAQIAQVIKDADDVAKLERFAE